MHSRRHLEKGISEKKLSFNSYFYGKFEFFIKDQILFKTNFKKNTNTLLNKSSKSKFIIAYNAKEIGQFYLNQHYDEVLIEHFLAEFCYEIRLRKIVIYNNKSFFDFKSKKRIFLSKSDLLKSQHILTHYKLKSNDNNFLLKGSIDFCKPKFLKKLDKENKINPSNYLYYDVYNHFLNKSSKSTNFNNKNKKILIVGSESQKVDPSFSWNDYIKKINTKKKFKFDFINTLDDQNFKISNLKKIFEINYQNIKNYIKIYDTIICDQSKLFLIINLIFKKNKNIIYYCNKEDASLINPKKLLFCNDHDYKYTDIFKLSIKNLRELTLYLAKKNF